MAKHIVFTANYTIGSENLKKRRYFNMVCSALLHQFCIVRSALYAIMHSWWLSSELIKAGLQLQILSFTATNFETGLIHVCWYWLCWTILGARVVGVFLWMSLVKFVLSDFLYVEILQNRYKNDHWPTELRDVHWFSSWKIDIGKAINAL